MICADTSSMVRFLEGAVGRDVDQVTQALTSRDIVIAPPTVTELLSHPKQRPLLNNVLQLAQVLPIEFETWEKAGLNRRQLKRMGLRATLADALIAQCCIDAGVTLIAHDPDFRHFSAHCGLKLAN